MSLHPPSPTSPSPPTPKAPHPLDDFSHTMTSASLSLEIPFDVHLAIIPFLAKPELAVYSRLSRAFNLSTTPYLYKRLVIDPSKKLTIPDFTPKDAIVDVTVAGGEGGQEGKDEQTVAVAEGGAGEVDAFTTRPDRFSYTTHLSIMAHPLAICPGAISPILPNLDTLYIHCLNSLSPCVLSRIEVPNLVNGVPRIPNLLICPYYLHLRPRRIIIGSQKSGISASLNGLHTVEQPFPPECVKELIVRIRVNSAFANHLKFQAMGRLSTLPASVESFSLILYPATIYIEMPWSRDTYALLQMGQYSAEETEELRKRRLWTFMRMALNGQAQNMLVAGLEPLNLGAEVVPLEKRAEELRVELKKLIPEWRRGWTADQVDSWAEAIRFITLEEYQEGEEEDVF